ncbi:MAG: 16S rRNA (guanine(966)-N(2))-methyltransferase RsmD [Verrucomicrobiales bacterium]
MIRVIAGIARGIPLQVPPAGDVRPTSDRVREALFSMITERLPGARCLDLFAGSGALGIEALSRGAESCVFVDCEKAAGETICANIKKSGLDGGVIRIIEVASFLESGHGQFDLIFADPPYAKQGGIDLAADLARSDYLPRMMTDDAILILESRKGADEYSVNERLERLERRDYGETRLVFFRRVSS